MGGPVIAVVVVAVIGLAAWLAASRAAAAPVVDKPGGDGSGAGGGAGGGTGGGAGDGLAIVDIGGTSGNGGGPSLVVVEPDVKIIIQPGDDGYHPSVTPVPGKYYQVKPGDNGSSICNQAGYPKPYAFFMGTVVEAPENQWIAYDKSKGWTGDLLPHYSGYRTEFGSGHLHPVVFLPLPKA